MFFLDAMRPVSTVQGQVTFREHAKVDELGTTVEDFTKSFGRDKKQLSSSQT